MPVHDWTRVDDGTFHAFHSAWNTHLMGALNSGLLPPEYYALAEQVASRRQTDVLTLQPSSPRREVVVRHVTGHRVVAVIEIVSPANKDRRANVRELAEKVAGLLEANVQVLLIDLLPPGPHDPQGMHAAVWSLFDPAGYTPPAAEPLTLACYRWDGGEPEVFLEPVGLGRPLIDMPLFLCRDRYVNVPLERTYQEAYRGVPAFWRRVLEGTEAPPG
jgi:hypothetical protein